MSRRIDLVKNCQLANSMVLDLDAAAISIGLNSISKGDIHHVVP